MRTTSYYILLLLLLLPVLNHAQMRPVLVDPGSNLGSAFSTLQYGTIEIRERELKTEIRKFMMDYNQRLVYLASSILLVDSINDQVNNVMGRYYDLQDQNNRLSTLFSYSKKKDNRKHLGIIYKMLTHIQNELNTQSNINVVYGEKLNLYQDVNHALINIERMLDVVEDNIETSKLTYRLLH